jgi:hypothetical protein
MVFSDLFQPIRYHLEKSVVSRSIPDITHIKNRLQLKNHPLKSCDESFDHSLWNNLLQRHVKASPQTIRDITGVNVVDYEGMGNDPEFTQYLEQLKTAKVEAMAKAEQLAFWMNAYNACAISLIVQHEKQHGNGSLTSITKLSSPETGPVWDKEAGIVGGMSVSLNDIEHNQLRQVWAEPQVHACIVCASASCPNLRREAYVATKLQEQMDDQMKEWMRNPTKGLKLDTGSNRLYLSRIFLWFADDFGGLKGLQQWLPQYISDKRVADKVASGKVPVRYFAYDWSMNRADSTTK